MKVTRHSRFLRTLINETTLTDSPRTIRVCESGANLNTVASSCVISDAYDFRSSVEKKHCALLDKIYLKFSDNLSTQIKIDRNLLVIYHFSYFLQKFSG